jgi:hypothetical protein
MSDEPQPTLKRKRPSVDDPPPPQPNPNLDQERRELTDAEQLKKTMREIEALSGGVRQLASHPADAMPPPASEPPPAAPISDSVKVLAAVIGAGIQPAGLPPLIAPGAFKPFDVVQVYSKEHRHYGVLFQVGDVKGGSVHGYILSEGGKREFITVKAGELHLIGESRVRLKVPCSGQWLAEHRETK